MPAYLVSQTEMLDAERYEAYKALAQAAIADHGGEYLARGAAIEQLEGAPETRRLVIVKFADTATARRFYESDAYREARKIREGAAKVTVLVIDGVPPAALS
jgi:uncharacterized protein (DUF1330 family)